MRRARQLDAQVASSVLAAAKTCILRNSNNSEKARMSRNLGRQSHRASQNLKHIQINNDIANLKSQLDDSSQNTKDLKAKLKDLSERKKEAGKSPRNNQAPSNRFDIPIPEIQGTPLRKRFAAAAPLTTIAETAGPSRSDDEVPAPLLPAATGTGSESRIQDHSTSLEVQYDPVSQLKCLSTCISYWWSYIQVFEDADLEFVNHSQQEPELSCNFFFPPFDFDSFNSFLEREPTPQPTAEEIEAHIFLRSVLGQ